MVCLSWPNPFKFFTGSLPQILLDPILNTLSHMQQQRIAPYLFRIFNTVPLKVTLSNATWHYFFSYNKVSFNDITVSIKSQTNHWYESDSNLLRIIMHTCEIFQNISIFQNFTSWASANSIWFTNLWKHIRS